MDKAKLMAMTVKELRAQAEGLGLRRISALKKSELVDAIVEAFASVGKTDRGSSGIKASGGVEAPKTVRSGKKNTRSGVGGPEADGTVVSDSDDDSGAPKRKSVVSDASDKSDTVSDTKDAVSEARDAAEPAAEVTEVHAPVEPDSVYIDRGAILPEYVPGTCLYALVRDPGTLFVYWNATFESEHGWLLTAYDHSGVELQSFTTPARRNGRGYFRVPTARVARVTLSIIHPSGGREIKLESRIRIAEQLGIAQPPPAFDERWVDVQNGKVVYEAPASGRAPEFVASGGMTGVALTGGGYDRSFEGRTGATSSRFGMLNAPGSSDSLVRPGSSDSLVRPGSSDTLVAGSQGIRR